MGLPPLEDAYAARIARVLQEDLTDRLCGVYLFGSGAYGDYQPGTRDIDIQAVVRSAPGAAQVRSLAERLSHRVLPCPARRLEFVCYPQAAIDPAARRPAFALNFNTGRDTADYLCTDPAHEASHWFVLDIAAGRVLGRSLWGPPAEALFAPIPRLWILEALADSLAWHRRQSRSAANTIANACRGWCYAVTGRWMSKRQGRLWAESRPEWPAIDADARTENLDAFVARVIAEEIEREKSSM